MHAFARIVHLFAIATWFGSMVFFTLAALILFREQGARLAGATVTLLFPWYYGLQAGCALVALATALAWMKAGRIHRLRALVLLLALGTAALGVWLEHVVHDLREQRDQLIDKMPPSADDLPAIEAARARFGTWHSFSLLQNFATLLLVTVALACAAWLPAAKTQLATNEMNILANGDQRGEHTTGTSTTSPAPAR